MEKSAKILIVEDDEAISTLLRQVLELENFRVIEAGNGKEALSTLESAEELPQIIILDMTMPVMDGAEFRRSQLAHEKLKAIPVILMTADSHLDAIARELKPTAVLKKPLTIESILQKVNELIQP